MVYSLWLSCTTRCKLGCMGANYCMHDASRVLLPTIVTRAMFYAAGPTDSTPSYYQISIIRQEQCEKGSLLNEQQHAPTEL